MQTNNDTKSPQQYSTYQKKRAVAFRYVGFNPTSQYIKKKGVQNVGLAQQTDTDTKRFNADFISLWTKKKKTKKKQNKTKNQYSHFKHIFNVGSIPHHYTYMYMKKVVYSFGFAWQTLTPKVFSTGLNALRTKMKKWIAMQCIFIWWCLFSSCWWTFIFKSRRKGYQESNERVMYCVCHQWWWWLFNWQLEVPFNCFLDLRVYVC